MATPHSMRSYWRPAALALACALAASIPLALAQDDKQRDKAVVQPKVVKPQAAVKGEAAAAAKKDPVSTDKAVAPPKAAVAVKPQRAVRDAAAPTIRAWQLPAASPAPAVAAAVGSSPANASPAVAARLQTRRLADVLMRHGFVGDVKADTQLGLPKEILTDRARVSAVLTDLRMLNPAPGGYTVMQKRLPESNDKETSDALDALRSAGTMDQLTAGETLADDTARLQRQEQCIAVGRAMDAQEANVRVIGGGAEPGAPHGSPAFWKALERTNQDAATAYRRAAHAYATACLDMQWQSLTPAQRRGMPAVVGFLHLDGVAECMGTRIATDRFLTARHCLYRFDRNVGWERAPMQRLQVVLAGQPGTVFDTVELDCDSPHPDAQCSPLNANNPLASDHLLLRLKAPPGAVLPPMPALRVDQAAVHQMLVVPGRSSWITGRALNPRDPVYVTVSNLGGCMIATNREGCLINSCQSEAGFSGAPMFARRKVDELVLVGIFLGSTAHNPYRQCQARDRNFGAVLPHPVQAALR